jgi:hypothetical protein
MYFCVYSICQHFLTSSIYNMINFLSTFMLCCLFYNTTFAQENRYISAQERQEARLKASPAARVFVDFEVKNQPSLSQEELNTINLANIESYRQESQRTEFFEPTSGYTIIVYSAQETTQNKTTNFSNPVRLQTPQQPTTGE